MVNKKEMKSERHQRRTKYPQGTHSNENRGEREQVDVEKVLIWMFSFSL